MTIGRLEILDHTGDTKLVWDEALFSSVEQARLKFNEHVGKGYLAYRMGRDGGKGDQITKFDPSAGRIILVPQMRGG